MVWALSFFGVSACAGATTFLSSLPHAEQNFTLSLLGVPHILHVFATSITSR